MKVIPRPLILFSRVIVTVGLFALLLRSLNVHALHQRLATIDAGWAVLGIIIGFVGITLSAVRWQLVLGMLGIKRGYVELLLRYWGSSFYNLILPGTVGGDVMRVSGLVRSGVAFRAVAISVAADRVVGLWAGMLLGLVSTGLGSAMPYTRALGLVFGLFVVAGIGIFILTGRLRPRLPPKAQPLVRMLSQLATWEGLRWLGLVLAFQSLVVLQVYVAGQAAHVPISLVASGLYAGAVALTTLLPISINGIGVRETTLVLLMAASGSPKETAILVGLLLYTTSAAASLPGILTPIFLSTRRDQSPVVTPP